MQWDIYGVWFSSSLRLPKIASGYLILVVGSLAWLPRNLEFTHIPDNPGYLKSVQATWNPGLEAQLGYQAIFLKLYTAYMCNVADIFLHGSMPTIYVYQSFGSHCSLQWVHMRYIYWHSCLLCYIKFFWYIQVISNSTRIMTPRIPYALMKDLCNLLDISIFHEYASIWPY